MHPIPFSNDATYHATTSHFLANYRQSSLKESGGAHYSWVPVTTKLSGYRLFFSVIYLEISGYRFHHAECVSYFFFLFFWESVVTNLSRPEVAIWSFFHFLRDRDGYQSNHLDSIIGYHMVFLSIKFEISAYQFNHDWGVPFNLSCHCLENLD